MAKTFNEHVAEILDTVVNSLPIDPADQERLKAGVAELHKHNKPAKKAEKKEAPKSPPNA